MGPDPDRAGVAHAVEARQRRAEQMPEVEEAERGKPGSEAGTGRHRGDAAEDHLRLIFRDEVVLWVPASKIHLVQKYVGAGDVRPRLDKLGGKGFARRKEEVERALFDMLLWPTLMGVLAILVYKAVSNQKALARVKGQITMRLLEIRLFSHDIVQVLKSTGAILGKNVVYLGNHMLPMAVMLLPFVIIIAQLVANYAYEPSPKGSVAEPVDGRPEPSLTDPLPSDTLKRPSVTMTAA